MSRGLKVAIAIAAGIVALNLLFLLLRSLTGGTPGGPASSSYSTSREGAAAYATLLRRAGHPLVQERSFPHAASLDSRDTAIVLDPSVVVPDDAAALRAFLAQGGRLVASDHGSGWLRRVLARPPRWSGAGIPRAEVLAPSPEVAGATHVLTAGGGSWSSAGPALPLLGASGQFVVAVAAIGRGRAVLIADSSFLQNRLLAGADNARVALELAGAPTRPVVFFETYHGYGRGSGLGAIPGRWRDALLLGALAAAVFMFSRVRRLGPPEPEGPAPAPARREYVEAVAATVVRTRDRDEALEPLRRELRRRIALRAGLPAGADDETLAASAARLGLPPEEVRRALQPGPANEPVLGQVFARTSPRRRQSWRS